MELALDTETTGLDLMHGCKPFYISLWCGNPRPLKRCPPGNQGYGETLDVDPFTREPKLTKQIKERVRGYVEDCDTLIFHNTKFDLRGLEKLGVFSPKEVLRLFDKIEDTVVAFHVLASGESHKLKDLALKYLDIPDDDLQDLKTAVTEARRIAKRLGWRIASPNDPHWPAMKKPPKGKGKGEDSWWMFDMWLPRELAKRGHAPVNKSHVWETVCAKYGNTDALRTGLLWNVAKEGLEEEGLWDQYNLRKANLLPFYKMESRGLSYRESIMIASQKKYEEERKIAEKKCFALCDYKMDNLNSDKQLKGILFGQLGVKPVKLTPAGKKAGDPQHHHYSLDKDCLPVMLENERKTSPGYHFLKNLVTFRHREIACRFIETYREGGVPVSPTGKRSKADAAYFALQQLEANLDYRILYTNVNLTGTDTTRVSMYNPNPQQVSKREKNNLRENFGPLPGREWYSFDYDNIEMRIFAYGSGDPNLIQAFEDGYSVHLIIAETLYPGIFDTLLKEVHRSKDIRKKIKQLAKTTDDKLLLQREAGQLFKDRYESTLYQWIKNGNFSLIYGAGQYKADTTYHLMGAYSRIRREFPYIDRFLNEKHAEAESQGFIETLGGYRLQVPSDGPHKAVNYYCQGSAGIVIAMAINSIDEYLTGLQDHHFLLQVHDELDFDFPLGAKENLKHARKIKQLMEAPSSLFNIPFKVSAKLIRSNWAEKGSLSL